MIAKNPLGAVETYQYDKLNRMIRAKLADGNDIQLTYDGYQDVLHAKDRQSEVDFTYTILGSLASRTQGGHTIAYAYNNQEELISVTNDKGEVYRFERDVKGNIVKEVGYDNLIRTYERDYSGLVTKINRPGGKYTKYCYDKKRQVIRADYHDGYYETFAYNKSGELIETENPNTKIRFERDPLGRIVMEWQGNHWISNKYDELGNQIQTTSSFGANILTSRNEMGQATHLVAYMDKKKPWAAKMEYNALGQETQRLFSNGICSSWEYDHMGRPIYNEVNVLHTRHERPGVALRRGTGYSESLRRRRYEWDVNGQLRQVANELTSGTTVYSYDQFSNLIGEKETGFEAIFRTTDSVGNLYETQDNSDRIYGMGSRLEKSCINLKEKRNKYQGGYGKLVSKGNEFFYDEEGNLAKKVEPNGSIWTYCYFGNGMLKEVVGPDESCVSFKYDSLGRRTEKIVRKTGGEKGAEGKVVKFLWNGNSLFHEWEEDTTAAKKAPKAEVAFKADYLLKLEKKRLEKNQSIAKQGQIAPGSLITWVFQDDFIPRGKITEDGSYSIICNYMGTPVEAYNEEGEKVWERDLDIYGRVKTGKNDGCGKLGNEIGEKTFIPFRFQGQYEDEETGLYYNRFRYYDSQNGLYIQQDPIGLAGENPSSYGYVVNSLEQVDPLGLSWSDVLRALNIPQPTGLTWPHGHHIVFKGIFRGLKGVYVDECKKILTSFKIGINDPANLMWASNVKGVHTTENIKKIFDRLKAMETELNQQIKQGSITFDQAQAKMKQELQAAGQDVYSRY